MSSTVQGLAIVGIFVLLSVLGCVAVQRSVPLSVREAHNDVAGFIYAVVGVVYAVLLGFVVVYTWQSFEEAEAASHAEANELADLDRLAAALPEPEQARLRQLVRDYANVVVEDEWPRLANGEASEQAWDVADRLQSLIISFQPRTAGEQVVLDHLLARYDELLDYRRLRLLHSRDYLPPNLMVVLVAGGVITVAFSYLFGLRYTRSHTLMVAGLATLIASALFVARSMESPFAGDFGVGPDAFLLVLDFLERG